MTGVAKRPDTVRAIGIGYGLVESAIAAEWGKANTGRVYCPIPAACLGSVRRGEEAVIEPISLALVEKGGT